MEESLGLVQDLYRVGAKEVLAVEIDEYEDGQNTGKLVIALPADQSSRSAILAITNDLITPQGFDAVDDVGQSYVFIMLD